MSEWAQVSLADLVEQVDERQGDQNVPLVLSVTEKRGIIPQDEVFKKRIATDDTSKYKVLQPLDIAYNPYLLWTGAIGQWDGATPGVTSPVYETFRTRTGHDPHFVGLVLTGGSLTPYFDATAIGSIQRRRRTPVPVFLAAQTAAPSLDEQRRIVAVMSLVDSQIKLLKSEAVRLATMRSALIRASLGTSTELCELGRYAEVTQGKNLPKRIQGQRTGTTPWFKIADMAAPQNVFGYVQAETRLNSSEIISLGGRLVPAASVVFPRVGAAVLTEKKRILDVSGAVDENHLVLTSNQGTDAEFLLGLMEEFKLSSLVQTGAVPSLNMGLMRSASVPLVAEDVQKGYGAALGAVRSLGRTVAAELAALRVVRADLLSSLLSQEITVDAAVDKFVKAA